MSRMSDLHIDISDALASGDHPHTIAKRFKVPVEWVESVERDNIEFEAAQREWAERSADADAIAYGEW